MKERRSEGEKERGKKREKGWDREKKMTHGAE